MNKINMIALISANPSALKGDVSYFITCFNINEFELISVYKFESKLRKRLF